MSKLHANLLLLFVAALWGFGNIQQNLDPLSAVGMRCLIGGLLVLPLIFREGRMIMALSIALQQIGYLDTSVTNASCA
ncbi:hypothetical protein [Mesorhizobium sp. M0220]|uniref:hypothetical protein n=1 Tax=unclassified Mesorhizobium TaxID=325217 RepID=UPI00333DDA95